jgi:hypothetical protein
MLHHIKRGKADDIAEIFHMIKEEEKRNPEK